MAQEKRSNCQEVFTSMVSCLSLGAGALGQDSDAGAAGWQGSCDRRSRAGVCSSRGCGFKNFERTAGMLGGGVGVEADSPRTTKSHD